MNLAVFEWSCQCYINCSTWRKPWGYFLIATFSFPVHTQRIQIELACPHTPDGIRIHPSTQGSFAAKCLQTRHRENRPEPCAAILIHCSVRDWARFCCVIWCENIRIHPSTRYRIQCRFLFSTLESGFKYILIDSLSNSPDTCGRKPYPERKANPDTCGQGLRHKRVN